MLMQVLKIQRFWMLDRGKGYHNPKPRGLPLFSLPEIVRLLGAYTLVPAAVWLLELLCTPHLTFHAFIEILFVVSDKSRKADVS
jgi:hypothetical protein